MQLYFADVSIYEKYRKDENSLDSLLKRIHSRNNKTEINIRGEQIQGIYDLEKFSTRIDNLFRFWNFLNLNGNKFDFIFLHIYKHDKFKQIYVFFFLWHKQ